MANDYQYRHPSERPAAQMRRQMDEQARNSRIDRMLNDYEQQNPFPPMWLPGHTNPYEIQFQKDLDREIEREIDKAITKIISRIK